MGSSRLGSKGRKTRGHAEKIAGQMLMLYATDTMPSGGTGERLESESRRLLEDLPFLSPLRSRLCQSDRTTNSIPRSERRGCQRHGRVHMMRHGSDVARHTFHREIKIVGQ